MIQGMDKWHLVVKRESGMMPGSLFCCDKGEKERKNKGLENLRKKTNK